MGKSESLPLRDPHSNWKKRRHSNGNGWLPKLSLIFFFCFSPVLRSFNTITHTSPFPGPVFPILSSSAPLTYVLWRLKKICVQISLQNTKLNLLWTLNMLIGIFFLPEMDCVLAFPQVYLSLEQESLWECFENKLWNTTLFRVEENGVPTPERISRLYTTGSTFLSLWRKGVLVPSDFPHIPQVKAPKDKNYNLWFLERGLRSKTVWPKFHS